MEHLARFEELRSLICMIQLGLTEQIAQLYSIRALELEDNNQPKEGAPPTDSLEVQIAKKV